jgi:hypothetical protein
MNTVRPACSLATFAISAIAAWCSTRRAISASDLRTT